MKDLRAITKTICNMLERDQRPVRDAAANELRTIVGAVIEDLESKEKQIEQLQKQLDRYSDLSLSVAELELINEN